MQSGNAGDGKGGGIIPIAAFSSDGALLFSNAVFSKGILPETEGDRASFLAEVKTACSGTPSSVWVTLSAPKRKVFFSFFPSSDTFGPVALAVAVPEEIPLETAPGHISGDRDYPVFISDPEGKILNVNESACTRFGYSRKEICALRTEDLVAPLCRSDSPVRTASLLRNGGGVFENLYVTREGAVFPFEVYATPVQYRKHPALLFVLKAIGGGNDAEQTRVALREMGKKYRSFFDAAGEGFVVTDHDGVVLDINERFSGLLGQPKRAVIGRPLVSFFAEDGTYDAESVLLSAIDSGCVRFDVDVRSPDGKVAVLAMECCPLSLQGEQYIRVIARDVPSSSYEEERNAVFESALCLSAFDRAGTGLVIIDHMHHIISANREAERIVGASADVLKGRQWMDFVEDPSFSAVPDESIPPGEDTGLCIENHEIMVKTTTGGVIPALLSVRTIPGSSWYIASVQDISRQSKTIGILSEHQDLFERIFSSGCEAFIVLDAGYGIRMWNTAAEEMFGYPADEVLGKNIFPLLFSCGAEDGKRIFRRFLVPDATSSNRSPAEFSLNTREGETVHAEASVSRFIHQEEDYLLLVIRDSTERYRSIRSLRENEEFLRFAIDAARIGTWDYDIEADLIRISDEVFAALFLSGQSSSLSGISSDTLRTIFHPDDLLTSEGISLAIMSGTMNGFEQELRLKTADDTWNWFAVEGKVVGYDPDGRPRRVVGIIRDVQDRKQAESAIREANRKLSLLAGVTRHDILNQIQGLLFYSEEMKTGEYTMEEMVVMAGKIFEMTETINRQITRTRNYDALGTEPPEWQNIRYLADEIVAGMDLWGLLYHNELPMVEIYADDLFADVIRTIVENASLHAEGATEITMSFAESEDVGIFTIEDDGCGISGRYKEKIFSHGFSKGSGGGLFIAREIAGVTGIELYETGDPGSGARFELRIPRSGYRSGVQDTEGI